MDGNNQKPKRIDTLVINDEAEVPSLLDPLSGKVFITNRVGLHVVELADGTLGLEEIVAQVAERFVGATREVIHDEVSSFLEQVRDAGLVEWGQGA